MNFLQDIDSIGTQFGRNPTERRYIEICNRVSTILCLLTLLLFIIAFIYFGWIASTCLALIAASLFLVPLLLNHSGQVNLSRIILVTIITIPAIIISIIDKFDHPNSLEEFEYFQFRIILLGSSIMPFLLFSVKEKKFLFYGLILPLLSLTLYDPLHNWFGAGYYQMGFISPNYYFLNYIMLFTYLVLTGSTYFLKYSFEKSENENESLIAQLSERQKEIIDANEIVKRQREELADENRILNKEIIDKNAQLTKTNEELIRHNNELQQFSYTISHNLKGPVASITGLLNLVDTKALNSDSEEIIRRINESVSTLDGTIKDLSNIIDLRNDITRIKQKIGITREVESILTLFKREIEENSIVIKLDFSKGDEVYSVKPMLVSILYNLISNAIKYRSKERMLEINIKSDVLENYVTICVDDNGIGIDLEKFEKKLFGLYQRFHSHTEGKGLGLFLVKLQAEALGGSIEVESASGKGSTFRVFIPIQENVEEQVLLDNDVATLYYNAPINCLGIYWKRNDSIDKAIEVINTSIEFIETYNTPNWISNLSHVVDRNEEKLNEFRRSKKEALRKAGLRRIALVLPEEQLSSYKSKQMAGFSEVYDVDIEFFPSMDKAKSWIELSDKDNSE